MARPTHPDDRPAVGAPHPLRTALSRPEAVRLELLARSARAAALTFELAPSSTSGEAQPGSKRAGRRSAYEENVYTQIQAERQWIVDMPMELARLDPKAYNVASAVIHNAFGQASLVRGDYPAALEALCLTVTLQPDFVDAYINLAQLYLKRKDRGGVDWADQAQWNLDRALGISPKNERANYLYGRLHAELDLPDVAIASLQNTSFLPEAQELLAKIYAGQQNYGEAVRHMRQAILLDGDANHRYLQFADYVLRLTRDPDAKIPNRKPLLEEALSRVKKVRKGDYQQWAARLKERLEKSISQTGNKSPAEPPAEETVPAPAPAPAPTPAAAPLDSPGL